MYLRCQTLPLWRGPIVQQVIVLFAAYLNQRVQPRDLKSFEYFGLEIEERQSSAPGRHFFVKRNNRAQLCTAHRLDTREVQE